MADAAAPRPLVAANLAVRLLLVLGAGTVALAAAGHTILAAIFAVVIAVNAALLAAWSEA